MFSEAQKQFIVDTIQQRIKSCEGLIAKLKKEGKDHTSFDRSCRIGSDIIDLLSPEPETAKVSGATQQSIASVKEITEIRILYIDDVEFMREVAHAEFAGLGYSHVVVTSSAEAGLKKLKQYRLSSPFGVVFCDWEMPGMSGIDLIKELRESDDFMSMPFVMVTGYDDAKHIKEAIDAGVTDYLTKPINGRLLDGKLRRIFASKSW